MTDRYLWKWPNGEQEVRSYDEPRTFDDWAAEVTPLNNEQDSKEAA